MLSLSRPLCLCPRAQSVPAWPKAGLKYSCRRSYASVNLSDFAELASSPSSKHQIYQSRSTDPYLNLSIEHFLLENTPPDSRILFLYANRPCVVIGRNQNPWLETNLRALTPGSRREEHGIPTNIGEVELVRRRSGGGAVFHDEGNLNYSVICPQTEFTRDKHAEMVVRALKALGAVHTRVNERHDIVLDLPLGSMSKDVSAARKEDREWAIDNRGVRTVKVSGSAYKLTRRRALHHGTCLLSSPNIANIGWFLRSPAKQYIKAKGVESFASPIGNISFAIDASSAESLVPRMASNVITEFATLYGIDMNEKFKWYRDQLDGAGLHCTKGLLFGSFDDAMPHDVPQVGDGMKELQSLDWKFGQTPQFTFSSHASEEDMRIRMPLPSDLPPSTRVFVKVKSGAIAESHIAFSADPVTAGYEAERVYEKMKTRKLHEIKDWGDVLALSDRPIGHLWTVQNVYRLARWLNIMLRI